MDPASLHQIISLAAALQIGGPILAVLAIWWIDRRDIARILKQNQEQLTIYREDTKGTSKKFEEYFKEVVQMYQSNVELVKNYQRVSGDFREVVVANTQVNADLKHVIKNNLFCPVVRDKTGN